MTGQRQKAPDQLVFRRGGRGRALVVSSAGGGVVPRVPRGLGPHARNVWRGFWRSRPSLAVELDADSEALHHWIRCVDERERLWPALAAAPLVTSSKGVVTRNPLQGMVNRLTRDIERAEERFGMTPLARFRLQLTISEAGQSADKLAQILERRATGERAQVQVLDFDGSG